MTILSTHLEGLSDVVLQFSPEEMKICKTQIENLAAMINNISSMPEENYWNTLFDIEGIANWLQLETVEAPIAEIGIIRVLKESKSLSKDAENVIYNEIPSPTGEDRSDIPLNLGVGQEVILFLNPHSRVLGPDYVILVDDSSLQLASYLLDDASDSQFTEMSADDFFEMITND